MTSRWVALGKELLERLLRPPDPTRAVPWLIRVGRQTWRRWFSDGCSREAASLAYKTALGIVPFSAVAFTLLRTTGMLDERSAFVEFFASSLFPAADAREAVGETVLRFADNMAAGAMGPLGLGVLITVVFLLFYDIEAFWNRVWSAPRGRPLLSKFFVFYTLATLVPFLLAVSLYQTARYWRGGFTSFFAPFVSTFIALLLANRMMPVVRVRWLPAALGAAVSAILLEVAKRGFAKYVGMVLVKYKSIYGAMALLPLVLAWIYLCWLLVLLGAEVAHAAQRLALLEAAERRHHDASDDWQLVNGATAARLVVAIAQRYAQGEAAPSNPELAERLALPEDVVARVMARLRERRIVVEAGAAQGSDEAAAGAWLPARPPAAITLAEVLSAFRPGDPEGARDALGKLLDELAADQDRRSSMTLADLLETERKP